MVTMEHFAKIIKCELCGWETTSAIPFEDSRQGIDCAASIFWSKLDRDWLLVAHYGSNFDMNMYQITDPTLHKPIEPICDKCIEKMEITKQISFWREVDWPQML